RRLCHVPDASDLAVKQFLPANYLALVVQLQVPEAFAPESGNEEVAFPLWNRAVDHDLCPARGGLGGRPDGDGIHVPFVLAALALYLGPAVVLPGLDPVAPVPRVQAELARVQLPLRVPRQSLHVAVTIGVNGVAGE